ncbi:MAG TPA: sulfatase-like hydrolase/transferase [Methylomirabilota bacterium]|nr:sulfatase-like hydrolase/transferase [Methylomirabilota bacterium]
MQTTEPTSTGTLQRLLAWAERNRFGIILLPWLATFASILSLKYSILISGGFHQSAVGLGHPDSLTTAETIALFRSDLLLCGVFIPLALCLLLLWLPLRLRALISGMFALVAEVVINFETAVYTTTGSFSSLKMLWVVIAWTIHSHDTSIISVPANQQLVIAAWIVGVGLAGVIAFTEVHKPKIWLNWASLVLFGAGCVAAIVACVPRLPDTAWKPSLLGQTAYAALMEGSLDADMLSRTAPELLQLYRSNSSIPPARVTPYTGEARGYNVLLFVMESIPAQVFDPARDSLDDMPNVHRLREHSFLLANHFTTFPLTNYAAFSIFTSMYIKTPVGPVIGDHHIELPGMIRSLNSVGYETAYYGYVWKIPGQRDDRMLESLGFGKIAEPSIDPIVDRQGSETFEGPIEYTEKHDLQSLEALRQDIHRWAEERQKFVAAYFPEIGHDPWREVKGQVPKSLRDRGHILAAYEDAWIGELLDELGGDNLLDRTIIVITSDHGLRRVRGSPGQPLQLVAHGKLDDIVIRVPMLIYVPKVLPRPVTIDCPTSHLDITPTILDLLGISAGRDFEQGTPVTDSQIAGRRLFLPMDIFGASGFYYQGNYFMEDGAKNAFENSSLHFDDANALPYNGQQANEVRKALADQDALQNALLTNLIGLPVR